MSQQNSLDYDANDQMIVSAAHLIRNNEAAYIGVGLPMAAALLAKRTHAPDSVIVIENGIIRTGICIFIVASLIICASLCAPNAAPKLMQLN